MVDDRRFDVGSLPVDNCVDPALKNLSLYDTLDHSFIIYPGSPLRQSGYTFSPKLFTEKYLSF